MISRFSERQFELCFNAEFINKNSIGFVVTPFIPSQRQETHLGYDVEFKIQNGGFSKSLFLQHKITSYIEHRNSRNYYFWICYNAPYFRFPIARLDKSRQHNLLYDLAQKGEDTFYCAPVFVGLENLQNYFNRHQLMDNSRFFSPLDMGTISDFEQHYVSCNQTGTYGFFHSEPSKLRFTMVWKQLIDKVKSKKIDMEYIDNLSETITYSVKDVLGAIPTIPEYVQGKGKITIIYYILRRYFNLDWILLK